MIELRECPFCGGESYLTERQGGYCVRCGTCGCTNEVAYCGITVDWAYLPHDSKEKATAAWNTRAGEQKAYEQGYEDGISNFMPTR